MQVKEPMVGLSAPTLASQIGRPRTLPSYSSCPLKDSCRQDKSMSDREPVCHTQGSADRPDHDAPEGPDRPSSSRQNLHLRRELSIGSSERVHYAPAVGAWNPPNGTRTSGPPRQPPLDMRCPRRMVSWASAACSARRPLQRHHEQTRRREQTRDPQDGSLWTLTWRYRVVPSIADEHRPICLHTSARCG